MSEEIDHDTWIEHRSDLSTQTQRLAEQREDIESQIAAARSAKVDLASAEAFAAVVVEGLDMADADPAVRDRIVEMLDIRGTLAVEDGKRVAHLQCVLGEASWSTELDTIRLCP